ncbi:MAG: HAD family hydrolase [Bifidobacteriaceae bacterium]|jgi:phosphoglycolate phosphatase-like HAD superfamily hydrolase|nr:HAD family hydrolase [Bifidobacteriaceae bacterium]
MVTHVVWDWNGTLLDDVDLVVQCASAVAARFGVSDLDRDKWRAIARRPMRATYDHLAGRPLTTDEWRSVQHDWMELYAAGFERAGLAPGAIETLNTIRDRGWTQSVVSTTPVDLLTDQIAARGVDGFFVGVAGTHPSAGAGGGRPKSAILRSHLAAIAVPAAKVVVIGDNPDDAAAAVHVGARTVLVATGDTSFSRLAATGHPVAPTLEAALTFPPLTNTDPATMPIPSLG